MRGFPKGEGFDSNRHSGPARVNIYAGWYDTCGGGLYGIQRLAQYLRRDIEAVRNAISESWSNGQTEGQINRLKTLTRAMYGRAGTELFRARMPPLRV